LNLFNSQGELNAVSLKDALHALTKYAGVLEENSPSNMALHVGSNLTDARKDELISRAIHTQEGKVALAQSMANPIR